MKQSLHPDFERISGDYSLSPKERPPLINGHGAAIGAQSLVLSTLERSDGAVLVSLALYIGETGIYHPMTPEGARRLAEKLILAADDAEGEAREAAKAALNATIAKGKPNA